MHSGVLQGAIDLHGGSGYNRAVTDYLTIDG